MDRTIDKNKSRGSDNGKNRAGTGQGAAGGGFAGGRDGAYGCAYDGGAYGGSGSMPHGGNITYILRKHGLRPVKSLGQNFLADRDVAKRITEAAELGKEDAVLEIGPGTGSLTAYLAGKAGAVICVEIDRKLMPVLGETLKGYSNVHIINADILKLDLKNTIKRHMDKGRNLKIVANLPYYITTPVIMRLLEERTGAKIMVFTVQKEVAGRMVAIPGGKEYGALSVAVRYYSRPSVVFDVPPQCFIPRPDVYSSVVRLDIYDRPPVDIIDEAVFFRLVKAAFGQRRKTLANALANSGYFRLSKDQAGEILASLGIDGMRRGETLSLEQFAQLSNLIALNEARH